MSEISGAEMNDGDDGARYMRFFFMQISGSEAEEERTKINTESEFESNSVLVSQWGKRSYYIPERRRW